MAPLDPKKGGTWFGINEAGLLVALTNRLDENPKPDAPSRGLLVRTILGTADNIDSAEARYNSLSPERYNPHRILFLSPEGVTTIYKNGESRPRHRLESGLFYLDNHSGTITDQSLLRKSLPVDLQDPNDQPLSSLEELCSSHSSMFGRDSICLHTDLAGTLSSSLIHLVPGEDEFEYRFAQGPPCRSTYESVDVPVSFRRTLTRSWSRAG